MGAQTATVDDTRPLLSPAEAARLANVSAKTIRREIARGSLPACTSAASSRGEAASTGCPIPTLGTPWIAGRDIGPVASTRAARTAEPVAHRARWRWRTRGKRQRDREDDKRGGDTPDRGCRPPRDPDAPFREENVADCPQKKGGCPAKAAGPRLSSGLDVAGGGGSVRAVAPRRRLLGVGGSRTWGGGGVQRGAAGGVQGDAPPHATTMRRVRRGVRPEPDRPARVLARLPTRTEGRADAGAAAGGNGGMSVSREQRALRQMLAVVGPPPTRPRRRWSRVRPRDRVAAETLARAAGRCDSCGTRHGNRHGPLIACVNGIALCRECQHRTGIPVLGQAPDADAGCLPATRVAQ
jgi:hypothetical protein